MERRTGDIKNVFQTINIDEVNEKLKRETEEWILFEAHSNSDGVVEFSLKRKDKKAPFSNRIVSIKHSDRK